MNAQEDYRRYCDECATFGITPATWATWWARYKGDYT